ncbi:hypothetical protein [Fibrobacter succinogenes]|uniref:hypothetical protein n=1 Tax=Fibrobacter succinogenes TaxID=833 RepID=UPI001565BEE6|nr:hypothetical protein [Fibrobacter succinogenes]
MNRFVALLLAVLCVNAFAVDHMWDIRYTFGPDTRPSPKWAVGLGVMNNYGTDFLFPVNFTTALSREWNIGGKVNVQTTNKFEHVIVSLDIGGRYLINDNNFIELDANFGVNRNNSTAVVVTFGNEQFISKNFANFYELRAGFLQGVTGEDGYVKLSGSITPTLYFTSFFRTFIEINLSGSVGNIKDDFMIDIIPKFELVLGSYRIRLDFDIGVMQEKNNDVQTIALYVIKAL